MTVCLGIFACQEGEKLAIKGNAVSHVVVDQLTTWLSLTALVSCAFASLDLISKYSLQVRFQGPKYFLCYVFRAY